MEPEGDAWLWSRDGAAEAVAERAPDGWWVVRDVRLDREQLGLVPVAGRAAMGVVDRRGRILGVVTPRGFRDAAGCRVLAVGDSSTGVHIVDTAGTVVAVGSRDPGGIDFLVGDVAQGLVFAVALATELVRLAAAA